MADFWRFAMAVGRHYRVLLGGGAAIVVILGIIERFAERNVPPFWYAGLLVALFFYASFLAWRDEDARAKELAQAVEDKYPKVDAAIEQMHLTKVQLSFDGVSGTDVPAVIVLMRILNTGAASIFQNFGLRIRRPEGTVIHGERWSPPREFAINFQLAPGRVHPMPFGIPLDERTMRLVERGDMVRGRLIWLFRNHSDGEIQHPGLEYEVIFQDAWYPHTKEHIATIQWQPNDSIPRAFPGMGMESPILKESTDLVRVNDDKQEPDRKS